MNERMPFSVSTEDLQNVEILVEEILEGNSMRRRDLIVAIEKGEPTMRGKSEVVLNGLLRAGFLNQTEDGLIQLDVTDDNEN